MITRDTLTVPASVISSNGNGAGAPLLGPRPVSGRLAKLCLVAADAGIVFASMLVAAMLRSWLGFDLAVRADRELAVTLAATPVWILLFFHYGLYSARHVTSRMQEFRRLVQAITAGVLAMVVVSFVFRLSVPRSWIALTLPVALALVTVEREAARRVFRALRRRGRAVRQVIIVGANAEAVSLSELLSDSPWLGYRVVGFADDSTPVGTVVNGYAVLGRVSDTLRLVREMSACGVLLATTAVSTELSNRLARQLVAAGVHVELTSSLRDVAAERLTVRPLGRCPVIYVEPSHQAGWRAAAKRLLDIVLSSFLLLLLPPLVLVVAVAIKLDSRGPVFFRQTRVGRGGRRFTLYKFRTMVTEAEQLMADLMDRNEADGPLFKIREDPRVTRVGKLLRRLSIDELPQLWNVLRGDMSLVGPRPALPQEVAEWAPELHSRLRVRPGLTGMWQVNGRSSSSFAEYVSLDLYYVENWTLWADLAIIGKTVPTVLRRNGAY